MPEILQFAFMKNALFASLIVGIICSLAGVVVILKGLSFMGGGIAHASFAGVMLALLIGSDPFLFSLAFSVIAALLIGYTGRKGGFKLDTPIGIMYSFTMALAILFIGLMKRYDARVMNFLFGSVLSVSPKDLWLLLINGVIMILFFSFFYKELKFTIFDEELASVSGIPSAFISYLFLTLLALTISTSLKSVGVILVFAMIVTPAAAAYELTHRFGVMVIFSVLFGIIASVSGLFISYYLNVPSGATIVLVITFIFIITMVVSPKRRRAG